MKTAHRMARYEICTWNIYKVEERAATTSNYKEEGSLKRDYLSLSRERKQSSRQKLCRAHKKQAFPYRIIIAPPWGH